MTQAGVRPLVAGGPILGVFDDAAFPSETIQLAAGDSVVFYSDGVTDAEASDGREFGLDRLKAAASEYATARPLACVQGLLAAVREFAGDAASVDDATIAVLRARSCEPCYRARA